MSEVEREQAARRGRPQGDDQDERSPLRRRSDEATNLVQFAHVYDEIRGQRLTLDDVAKLNGGRLR